MTFWEVYSSLCEKAGEKPQPLGKKLGAASSTVTQWKSGSIPSGEKLIAIADYFDCSIDYLLGREQKSSLPELTENEQAIVKVFKELTDTQQGEIIGRAKVMAEQNGEEYLRKESVS